MQGAELIRGTRIKRGHIGVPPIVALEGQGGDTGGR